RPCIDQSGISESGISISTWQPEAGRIFDIREINVRVAGVPAPAGKTFYLERIKGDMRNPVVAATGFYAEQSPHISFSDGAVGIVRHKHAARERNLTAYLHTLEATAVPGYVCRLRCIRRLHTLEGKLCFAFLHHHPVARKVKSPFIA